MKLTDSKYGPRALTVSVDPVTAREMRAWLKGKKVVVYANERAALASLQPAWGDPVEYWDR